MTEPQTTPAGEDQPMSEAERPPGSGEVAALAQEIARIAGRLAEVDETLSRRAGGLERLDRQAAELARLLADLSQDQDGQLDENERLDRRLDALGQDVKTQRQAIAELENHLDDTTTQQLDENERLDRRLGALGQDVNTQRQAVAELGTRLDDRTTLAPELAGRQAAQTRGERAIWWPDLPAGPERAAALRLLRAWVDDVLRGHHPELARDSLQACWYRHDDVLDELTALQAAWHAAYRGTAAPATAAIEWHDRWLPGCMARCKAAIKARPCATDGHQSPAGTQAPGDPAAVKEPAEPGPGQVTANARALWRPCKQEPQEHRPRPGRAQPIKPRAYARAPSTRVAGPSGLALSALSGQVPVDRGAADAEGPGDLGRALAAIAARPGGGELARIHHGGPPADLALRPRGLQAGHGALVDDVPLQLGEGGHHREEELALAVGGVGAGELAGEDPDADAAVAEVTGDGEHFLDGAAEPVELPDGQRVTGPQVAECGGQARAPGGGLAGAGLLGVDPGASREDQGVLLELGVLRVGGHAREADQAALAVRHVEDRAGGCGGCGVRHIPQGLKTVSQYPAIPAGF